MELKTIVAQPATHSCDALVVFAYEDPQNSHLSSIDASLGNVIVSMITAKDFLPESGALRSITTLGKLPCKTVLLVGLGKIEKVTLNVLRKTAASSVQLLRKANAKRIATTLHLAVTANTSLAQTAQAVTEGILLGLYQFDEYKTIDKEKRKSVESVEMLCTTEQEKQSTEGIQAAKSITNGVLLARRCIDLPANIATPAFMIQEAQTLAKTEGLLFKVLGKSELEKEGCGAILAVGRGSVHEPSLVILEYGDKKLPATAIIGKGITYDSGGINIKPTGYCETMKCDMAGAATVLGALKAIAGLKLPVHVVGAFPLAENMVSGNSYRPGDILTAYNKKTIEIGNTDAEGRVVLADALSFVEKNYAPACMIDLATLTGACIVALGSHASGIMGTDENLITQLIDAGESVSERMWRFPMWDEYADMVKSDIADVRNTGKPEKEAGAIMGAMFLKQFVDKTPWAHIDIAGPAFLDKESGYLNKGGTGWGVRLLVEFLRQKAA